MADVKFGVMLPVSLPSTPSLYHALQYGYRKLDFEVLKSVTSEAERLGYHSVWVSDHLSREVVRERFECWTTLSVLASMTDRLRLGTMVLCNLYRHPGLLAKMAATLDVLSGGRLEFGIGACWSEPECRDYGIDFPIPEIRLRMLKESIEVIKRVWTQEKATYLGKYYRIKEAYCDPKPIQKPHPPLMIGGGGEELTLRIVARHADKSNFGGSVENVSRKLDVLRKHCSTVGRDYDSIEKTCNLNVVIHPTREEYLADMKMRYESRGSPGSFKGWMERAESTYIAGTPEECVEQIGAYVDLGISLFVIRFGDIPKTDGLKLFAKEVCSKIR